MKNTFKSVLCGALAATLCFGVAACGGNDDGGDEFVADGTNYNIVFTLATIPPVLAALDSIGSGYETYALIERGKTYSGIETTEGLNFHNVGFDVSSNESSGFTQEQFDAMVETIKELNAEGNEMFHIYLRDADPMFGYGLAANAQLKEGQYELILCEDGRSSYNYFTSKYVTGKTATAEDDQPYKAFVADVNAAKETRDKILKKSNNKLSDLPQDFGYGLAASALEHVTWRLQAPADLGNRLTATSTGGYSSKLASVLGGGTSKLSAAPSEQADPAYQAKIKGGSISEGVSALSSEKRTAYLSLMYGNYYEDTYSALTRTTLSDGVTAVPAKKLVFIGNRIKSGPAVASNAAYGIGGAETAADVPDSYAALADKYKTPLLFGTAADYQLFLDTLADNGNYAAAPTAEQADAIRVQIFNYYINYMFVLKFTYANYGADYDIIVKGHPSEVLGDWQTWTNHYTAGDYTYDRLMDALVTKFHESDSVGKYIGMVPYGTAAENLAYLGADIAIGGLASSTYTGYDVDVDVKFVLNPKDKFGEDIDLANYSVLSSRYSEGTLHNHNAAGEEINTVYYNSGYLFKSLVGYYTDKGDAARAAVYKGLLDDWLGKQGGIDVDEQGFVTKDHAE